MSSLTLLADLDAERVNGGWGKPRRQPKGYKTHKPSYSSSTVKTARTNLAQGNVSNNLALGLGIGGLGFANASSFQENVAFIATVA
jgi:hypothetical protein